MPVRAQEGLGPTLPALYNTGGSRRGSKRAGKDADLQHQAGKRRADLVGAGRRVDRGPHPLVRHRDGVRAGAVAIGPAQPLGGSCAYLALGAGYAALDTSFHRMGEVFLHRWPLFVASMEATFIALLCYHDTGLDSPFRWYYLLSLICCSIRYSPPIAWTTFALHCLSFAALAIFLNPNRGARGGLDCSRRRSWRGPPGQARRWRGC